LEGVARKKEKEMDGFCRCGGYEKEKKQRGVGRARRVMVWWQVGLLGGRERHGVVA